MQKKNKLGRRMYVQNFVLVAIPTVFIVCISLFMFQNIFKQYAEDYESLYMKNVLNQSMSTFDRINNDLTINLNHLASSDEVKIFLMNDKIIDESDVFQKFINAFNSIAQSSIILNDYIKDIEIYSEVNRYVYSTANSDYIDRIKTIEWMPEYEKGERHSRYLVLTYDGKKELVFLMPIAMYGTPMGAIVIRFDYECLLKHFNPETYEYFQICSTDDKVVLSSYINNIGKHSDIIENVKKGNSFGKYYSLASDESSYTFYIIANAEYTKKVEKTAALLYRVMFISIVCLLILVALIAIKVYFPIKKISDLVLERQDSAQENYSENYKKEYEYIIGNIQNALDNNLFLREQLSEKLEKLNKMHMVALQAQINPHFMYNTLQMIALCAEEQLSSESNIITNSIKILSDLMQMKFSTQNPLTTLEAEVKYLMMYYRLQHELYGDMITLEVKIPEELDGYAIPKITLQPILENAIQSGIKPSGRKCTVIVAGNLADDKLELYVSDDGIGIEEDVLNELRNKINSEDLAQDYHIGLCNINQRIKLIFGREYGITIDSSSGFGTRIGIVIPAKKMSDIIGEPNGDN